MSMQRKPTQCSGPLSRRSFLEIGSLAACGLGLSDLLRLRSVAATTGQANSDTAVILVWLPGGPLETLGRSSLTIRYSHASWKQIVAELYWADGKTFVTEGAMPITQSAGVLKIPLLNYMQFLPRAKKLVVVLRSNSLRYGGSSGGKIAIGRVTLKLSVLQRAVSH